MSQIQHKEQIKSDNNHSHNVWIIIEQRFSQVLEVSIELLGEGKKLARQLGTNLTAILLGSDLKSWPEKLVRYGADQVIYTDHPLLEQYNADLYLQIIGDLIIQKRPEIVIFGATIIGRELAPAISARLQTGLTADCTKLEIGPSGNLLQTRPAFGGNLMATIECQHHRPQMCTVRPGIMKKPIYNNECNIEGKIILHTPAIENLNVRTKILQYERKTAKNVSLEKAECIVAGGRGLGSKKGFKLLQKLADRLNGCIAGSRACVDNQWISKSYQIGQTGKIVRPKLYIACGISGAIQHIAGMQKAECIIAINTDPKAPIFNIADYGIVGDLYKIIPELIRVLDQETSTKTISVCNDSITVSG